MILFLFPEIYLIIRGILLTFDLFVPGDILRRVFLLIYETNRANSSNDSKQYMLNIKTLLNPFLSHGLMMVFQLKHVPFQYCILCRYWLVRGPKFEHIYFKTPITYLINPSANPLISQIYLKMWIKTFWFKVASNMDWRLI